jgi:hypothetical protein
VSKPYVAKIPHTKDNYMKDIRTLDSIPMVIEGLKSASILIKSNYSFFPKNLVVPHPIAGDFLITDIKIRRNSQLYSVGCVPATIFSARADPKIVLDFEVVEVGDQIVISVINQSPEPRTFTCSVSGPRTKDETVGKPQTYILGYGSTSIPAHNTGWISAKPLQAFHPERLVIPSHLCDKFSVLGIAISRHGCCLENFNLAPAYLAQSFHESSLGLLGLSKVVDRDSFLSLNVKNLTDSALNFQAAVAGQTIPAPLHKEERSLSIDDKNITLRRTLQQAIHCLTEAGSVLKHKEDPRCAVDDVMQAQELIHKVIKPGIDKLLQCSDGVSSQ